MAGNDINQLKRRMQGALSVLKTELNGLRTGRASAHLLDPIHVEVAHKYAETAKVAVRHVRRDGMDALKKMEKDHQISEDDHKRMDGEVQKATDQAIIDIDHLLAAKEKEIMTV